jgi:hypothetical protein
MVQILKIAYGTSWKSRKRSWIRTGEEVGLYKSKIGGNINSELPGKSTGMHAAYIIHHSESMYDGGSEIERP